MRAAYEPGDVGAAQSRITQSLSDKKPRRGGFQAQTCLLHSPVDHAEQTLHQVSQVRHPGTLVREDGPVHGGQLGQALQGVLGHVRVLPDLPVHLQDESKPGSKKSQKGIWRCEVQKPGGSVGKEGQEAAPEFTGRQSGDIFKKQTPIFSVWTFGQSKTGFPLRLQQTAHIPSLNSQ